MQAVKTYDHLPGYVNRWKGLIFIGLSVTIISMDNTILNNALPAISSDLRASQSDLQWIADSYILVFAALMLTMGAVGDRIGRKKTLLAGLFFFGLGSLAAALANSTSLLIAARGFLGIGAAILMPTTLSIISASFPGHERAQAIAIWAAIFSLGVGIGPPLGGWLVQTYSWNSVFLVNIPFVIAIAIGGIIYLGESRDETAPKPDIPGVILSIAGLFALIYAIIEAGTLGWTDPKIILAFIVAAILLTAFGWWENRNPDAMMPLYLFKNPTFTGSNAVLAFVMFSLFGSTFFISQYLQTVIGFSPWDAGLRVLPTAIPMTIAATLSARLAGRIGTKYTVTLGIGLGTCAVAYMAATYRVGTPYEVIMIGQILLGTGLGTAVSPATTAIMSAVPVQKSGIGSAMNTTTRQIGGALGIALLGAVMNSVYLAQVTPLQDSLPQLSSAQVEQVISSIQAAHVLAGELPAAIGQQIIDTSNLAFVNGMTTAMIVGAIMMTLTTLLALFVIPTRVNQLEDIMPRGEGDEPLPDNIAVMPIGH